MRNQPAAEANLNQEWYYDDRYYYSYVLMNGSLEKLREVKRQLQSNQIWCHLTGKSHKAASNGNQYQWYLRVSNSQQSLTQSPPVQKVESVLGQVLGGKENQTGNQAKLVSIESSVLTKQLLATEKEVSLQKQIVRQQKKQLAFLQSELSDTKAQASQLKQESNDWSIQELKRLQQKNEIQEQELSNLLTDNLDVQQQRDDLAVQLENQQFIQNDLESKLSEAKRSLEITKLTADVVDQTTVGSSLIKHLLPGLQLLRGSDQFLFSHEVKEPAQALSVLYKLEVGQAIESERVKTARSWWEISQKINYGDGGAKGRIYYRPPSQLESKCEVIISYKKFQRQDIKWMQKN